MTKYLSFVSAALVFGLMIAASQQPGRAQDKNSGTRTIKVRLNYTGSGAVDEKHRISVALWNSPDFMSGGGMPEALGLATSKDATVTITATTSPVYVSAAYDPSGNWDGQSGPPPAGSSLGLYSKTPGKPEPIEVSPGKTAEIELTFDDSVKMH